MLVSLTEICLLHALPSVIIQTPCLMAQEYIEVSYGSQVNNVYFLKQHNCNKESVLCEVGNYFKYYVDKLCASKG